MKNVLKRKVTVAAAAVVSLGWVASANASPLLSYQIFDGATLIGSGSSAAGTVVLGTGIDANFTVALNAVGAPADTAPDFSTSNFNIATTGAAGTLRIYVTDTGLTSPPTNVMNTFTTNSLAGGGFLSDSIANYYDTSNTAYGTGTLLASASYSGKDSFSTGPIDALISSPGLYSETTIYTLNFGGGATNSSVTASSQIIAATPEPNSLVLLGTGLFGAAGMVFKRRRQVSNLF